MNTILILKNLLKKNISKLIFSFLGFNCLRRRIVFILKSKFFHELDFEIPVGENLIATLPYNFSYDSLSEVFFRNEYKTLLADINLPKCWLDIGCHMGYFSLWMECENRKQGNYNSRALLLDADSRTKYAITKLTKRNNLKRWRYFNRGIGDGKLVTFYQRDYMSSSIFKSEDGVKSTINNASEDLLMNAFPGPYDLVKIDIEGSEWEFLDNYQNLLKKTHHLIMEWHSWHNGGRGEKQLINRLNELGFEIKKSLKSENNDKFQTGLILACYNA